MRCRSAGRRCPRAAVLTARMAGIGDRALCRPCFDAYLALMGEDIRLVEPIA